MSRAQITADLIRKGLDSKIAGVRYPDQIKKFYELLNYHAQWMNHDGLQHRLFLFDLIATAERYGLNKKDYHYDLIQSFPDNSVPLNSGDDSVKAELLLSDATIHFFIELAFGNQSPEIQSNGLGYKPGFYDVSEKLVEYITTDKLQSTVSAFEPQSAEYVAAKSKLIQLLAITNREEFKEVVVISNKVTNANLPLMTKFYQLGFLDSANRKISDEELKDLTKKVQELFNEKPGGVLSNFFFTELNIPVLTRIEELKQMLNCLRWLENARQSQPLILVNIPSATLMVYNDNKLILESKIIVGKPSTPTPTLTSRVTEVILYPYWTVPNKIAVKELLPSIKRNIDFLEANNYQVLDRQGKVINPYKIDWSSLGSSNFPYIIRQSTGCDNSLGIVKLNFDNPFGVYLHDTPGKTLFDYDRRYFSHGCMRVQKAIELAHLVLKGNEIAIDTLEEKGCLLHQSPVIVPANLQMAVFVLYNIAWINSDMNINFSQDVYKKLRLPFKDR